MNKPNNYDATPISDYTPIELGGHYLVIKRVEEAMSKENKDMIIVSFDTALEDKQPGFFMNEFKNDSRSNKKWPRAGRQYILVNDNEGNCSRSFKRFINCVEKSNDGFVTQWGEGFVSQFLGKRVGGVFGEVENEYNGRVTMRHELRWFCSKDAVESAGVPEPKLLPNSNKDLSLPEGFINIPDGINEEVPFL